MKKYTVTIEETVSEDFEIVAESEQEALEIAKQKYNSGEFVLAPGFVQRKQMAVFLEDEIQTEWMDF